MKKKVISFITVLMLIAVAFAPVSRLYAHAEQDTETGATPAEETFDEAFFTTIEKGDLFVVYAEWEKSQPKIKFRSPSGVIFDTSEETEGTHISVAAGAFFYQIDDPEAGDWYILYNKVDNDTISVELEQGVSTPFIIKDLTLNEVTASGADIFFMVDYAKDVDIRYRVSITSSDTGTGEVIYEGYSTTNEEIHVTLNLERFGSYSNYRFYVYAYYDKNGVEVGEGAYTEPFSYINPSVGDMQTPVTITVEPDGFLARVNFAEGYKGTYLIAYYEDGATEPTFFDELTDYEGGTYDYVYNTEAKTLTIEISEKYGNRPYSNPKRFTIDIEKLPSITFEDKVITNNRFIELHYSGFALKTKLSIDVNSDRGEYVLNAATGDLTIAIADDYNEIEITYDYAENVNVLYQTDIYMDVEAPRIYMLQDYTDVTTTARSYTVSGTVTGANLFTIEGKEVTLNSDGSFIYSLDLANGQNIFKAEAKDGAGNVSVYTITITSEAAAPTPTTAGGSGSGENDETKTDILGMIKNFLPAIIAAVLGIALIIFVIVTGKKEKETTVLANIRKIAIFAGILGLVLTGYSAYKFITTNMFVNSTAFIDLAYESIDAAGVYLRQLTLWKIMTIAGAGELVACIIALIVVAIIGSSKKKKVSNADVAPEPKE